MDRAMTDKRRKDRQTMILYFTGTGNSRHIAGLISELTGDTELRDMGAMIKSDEQGDFCSEKPFVFVAPTYAWRLPRVVSDFIMGSRFSLRNTPDKIPPAYFVLTCGSSIGNAGRYARRLCEAAGLRYCGCAGVRMPENYIAMFSAPDEETSERIIRAAGREIRSIAGAIASGDELDGGGSLIGAVESSIVNNAFYKFVISADGFRVTESCNGCGLCSDVCPLNNIKIDETDGRPKWGKNCTHCMACICRCPGEAIEYKNISVGKRRYYLK